MDSDKRINVASLIHNGGVLCDVEGESLEEVFQEVSKNIKLPPYLSSEQLCNGLINREGLLSTAVGNGIALPHPGSCLIKNVDEQFITVVYLKHPIKMATPDLKPVHTLFIILTMNSYYHMKVIEELSSLLRNIHFITAIQHKVTEPILLSILNGLA